MNKSNTAVDIIRTVFSKNTLLADFSFRSDQRNDFLVIPGKHSPRWIVPSQPDLGIKVLSQWHPYSFISTIKWKNLLFIYKIGLLNKIPGIDVVFPDSNIYFKVPGIIHPLFPIIYVGTPGLHQKAVVTLVSLDTGFPHAVMKVALSKKAQLSIQQEAITLEKLSINNVSGAPTLIAVEKGNKRTLQTMINGPLTSRRLTQAHIDWLLHLPRSKKTTTFKYLQKLLRHKINGNPCFSIKTDKILSQAIDSISNVELPLILVHGDFTPWNLKLQPDKTIAAIDWESARWYGLPLWDICHFFFIQTYLFREKKLYKKIFSNIFVEQYIKKMGIEKNHLLSLALMYILFSLFDNKIDFSESYKAFLIKQIPILIRI